MITVKKQSLWRVDLTVESDTAKLTENIASTKDMGKGYEVSWPLIKEFWGAIVAMADFNDLTEVELMQKLYDKSLSKAEQKQFLELINPTT